MPGLVPGIHVSGELAAGLFEDGAVLPTTTVVIPAKAGIQYSPTPMSISEKLWILDRPLEPVIGRRAAATRWRAMTAKSFGFNQTS